MKKSIAFPAAAIVAALVFFTRPAVQARPDVVSAASITVAADSITTTTARITYTRDKYNYGTRTLCYDPAPATPANNCVTHNASGNSGSFSIKNLTAKTTYNFSVKAVDTQGNERPYTSTGSFTTLASTTSLETVNRENPMARNSVGYNLQGRHLVSGTHPANMPVFHATR